MSTEHTPGPWKAAPAESPTYSIGPTDPSVKPGIVAVTVGGNDEANARLIAAAPDLLDLCQALLDRLETTSGRLPLEPVQQRGWAGRLRVVIAKATTLESGEMSKGGAE